MTNVNPGEWSETIVKKISNNLWV